jgi:hypothetical protein
MFNICVSLITHIHQKHLDLLLYHLTSEITGWQVVLEFWAVIEENIFTLLFNFCSQQEHFQQLVSIGLPQPGDQKNRLCP